MPLTLRSSWLNLSPTQPTLQINPAATLADLGEMKHQAVHGLFPLKHTAFDRGKMISHLEGPPLEQRNIIM